MAEPKKASQAELDLPLASVLSHKLFPGRTTLMIPEVAMALGCDEKHVISLINEGDKYCYKLDAIEITGRGNKTSREHWRVPVSGLDAYIRHAHNKRRDA